MKTNMDRKMYMGIGRFMIPIPQVVSNRGLEKGASGARAKAELLSEEERRVHYFVVKKMAVAKEPITAELVGEELGIPVNRVEKTIDKLESLYIYENPLKDEGFKHLKRLKTLKNLSIFATDVTEEGVMELRSALPKCRIDDSFD